MTPRLALVFAVFLVSPVLVSGVAIAKPKVALTQIEGDTDGDVRDAVAEALDGSELSLIGSREVNRAVDKLGDIADLTEKDFKKLANELEADAIVLGKLDKVGGARTLRFRLYVHKKMAKGFTVSFKDAKSEKFRSLLHDKMIDKLGANGSGDDEERPARKRSDDDDESLAKKDRKDRKPARRAKADDDDDERPRKPADDESEDEDRPARKRSSDDEPPRRSKKKVAAADETDDVEAGISARADGARPANRVAARIDAGVSVVQRSFKFNANDFAQKPRNLTLSPVPGVRFEAEAYPLAFGKTSGLAAGLGLGVEYDRTLALSLVTANNMGTYTAPV
jgi:hypothetical protein